MKRLTDKLLNWLIKSNEISDSEREIYRYAVERLVIKLLPMSFILLFGSLYGEFLLTIVISAVFLTLRKYSGGKHATTMLKCFIMSVCILCGLILLACHTDNSWRLLIVVLFCSMILLILGPERKNGTLDKRIFIICKRKLYISVAIIITAYISLSVMNMTKYAVGISMTAAVVTLFRIPCSFKKEIGASLQV